MNLRKRILVSLLMISATTLAAHAAAPTFADKVTAIEAAQTAELARLNEAIAAAADPAEVLGLQRCAAHVKLASRLALHEAQLEVTTDEALRATLTDLVEDLSARLEVQKDLLPSEYAFDPLAAFAPEVPPCDE